MGTKTIIITAVSRRNNRFPLGEGGTSASVSEPERANEGSYKDESYDFEQPLTTAYSGASPKGEALKGTRQPQILAGGGSPPRRLPCPWRHATARVKNLSPKGKVFRRL